MGAPRGLCVSPAPVIILMILVTLNRNEMVKNQQVFAKFPFFLMSAGSVVNSCFSWVVLCVQHVLSSVNVIFHKVKANHKKYKWIWCVK